MKELAELILILCFTMYFFGFPVDVDKLLDTKKSIPTHVDCPKEVKKEVTVEDGPKPSW
jgi:hypothetical protein